MGLGLLRIVENLRTGSRNISRYRRVHPESLYCFLLESCTRGGQHVFGFCPKVELYVLFAGGSQGNTRYCQDDLGVMIFKSPEFGSLRCHGELNHARKSVFIKLKMNTPRVCGNSVVVPSRDFLLLLLLPATVSISPVINIY